MRMTPEAQFPQKNRWVLLRKTVLSQTKQALARPDLQICPNLVRVVGESLLNIEYEISRRGDLLDTEYAKHKRGEVVIYASRDLHADTTARTSMRLPRSRICI